MRVKTPLKTTVPSQRNPTFPSRLMTKKVDFGNWHDKIGSSAENSPNREAPNKHIKGSKKYKEMVAKDTKRIDSQGNMPFSFSKPAKSTRYREDIYHVCDSCHHVSFVSKHRAGQVCKGCKAYTSVNKSNTYETEEEVDLVMQELSQTDG